MDDPDTRDSEEEMTTSDVIAELEPLEPYTTTEVASKTGVPVSRIRRLLRSLNKAGQVERKTAEKPIIWVRKTPVHTCPSCEREFFVRFTHPVLGAVQFCPRCGTQLKS
ncbi:helix-turn-helix domain-containing protein (plasmid) [Halobacterium sp. NMX12-1]|uniref:Helix-turn-helix domain-containing protein n=1 Tax=Halobacterium sp. NMX12-1 TaxID=3166650 RepID=A0AAU8C9W1_9EURY